MSKIEDVRPDPTSDLQWGLWNGSIHETLHKNATKFPERQCVVETHPYREFTYRQINHASNILAHHFVSAGIQRGDVVMIYAFRNVDLVIAIMGTLKAGATFSGKMIRLKSRDTAHSAQSSIPLIRLSVR